MILDEESFVDLYEVLDMPPEADALTLRRRISELYLEARDNLEHQSHRKRFYYRELYEVHLPLARLIFLDGEKRVEYDAQLQAYFKTSGKPPSIHKPRDAGRIRLDHLPGAATAEVVDPFAEFADTGGDLPLPPLMPTLRMNPKDVEQRRNLKRRELIKHELITQGLKWKMIAAGATAIVLLPAVMGVLGALEFNSANAYGIGLVAIAALSALAARQASRAAKKRAVATLSQMPYDELLRHCGS